jgi:hypothetical protein
MNETGRCWGGREEGVLRDGLRRVDALP